MLELLGEVGEEGKSRDMEILVAAGVEGDRAIDCAPVRRCSSPSDADFATTSCGSTRARAAGAVDGDITSPVALRRQPACCLPLRAPCPALPV
jgi:hypothetical protein